MNRIRLALVLLAMVALATAAGFWTARALRPAPKPSAAAALLIGKPAPPLQIKTLTGEILSLSDFRGQTVVLNFWASWCPPCIEEMPLLDAFAKASQHQSITVIGIAVEDEVDTRAFLQLHPVSYVIGLGSDALPDESHRFGNVRSVLPYTVLIDAEGVVQRAEARKFVAGEIEDWVAGKL